jgi:hypothetical protein
MGVRVQKWNLLAFFSCLLFCSLANAEVYKWVDKSGSVHYGDKPDENSTAKQVQIETISESRRAQALERQKRLLKNAEEAEQRAQAKREAAKQSGNNQSAGNQKCFDAMKHLTLLQKQLPIYIDEQGRYQPKWKYDYYQGNRRYLSDKERDLELKRAQNKVESLCANATDSVALEKAATFWQREEWCMTAKVELREVLRPEARSTEHDIERYRKRVAISCAK